MLLSEYGSVTQCPHCKTSFHVGPIQLEAANGHVRCGGCLKVFDANEHFLIEQKPLFGGSAEELLADGELQPDEGFQTTEDGGFQTDDEALHAEGIQSTEETQSDEEPESEYQPEEKLRPDEDPDEEFSIIPERFNSENDDDFYDDDVTDGSLGEAAKEIVEDDFLDSDSDSDFGPDLSSDSNSDQIEQEELEVIYLSHDDSQEVEGNIVDSQYGVEEDDLDFQNTEPSNEETEHRDSELEEIDSILDEAYDELEEDLSLSTDGNPSDIEDDWQPLIAERTGANAEEPTLSRFAGIDEDKDEDEELAEQLFVDSEGRRTHKKMSLPWFIGVTVLFLVLFAQTLYWQPSTLRQSNLYNQISLNYCAVLPCRELILQDLSQLYVTGLVRPSDEYSNALSVQVEVRNRAEQAQRFPHIELAFTDLRGQKISLRRFSPDEYLRAETVGRTVLEPFQRIQIEMELYDPGASAISYEFNLLFLD